MMRYSNNVVPFIQGRELGNSHKFMNKNVGKNIADQKASKPVINKCCQLSGQTRSTFILSMSHDGSRIVSTHGDHSVRVTDAFTGQCLHVLTGHPRTPWTATFHPNSNTLLASGCLDGDVRIWDLTGHGSETWKSPKRKTIASLAFHPTKQMLVIATSNKIYFWDWNQPHPFAATRTNNEYEKVRWVKFDPLGHYLLTGITNCASREEARVDRQNPMWGSSSAVSQMEQIHLRRRYLDVMDRYSNFLRDRERLLRENPLIRENNRDPETNDINQPSTNDTNTDPVSQDVDEAEESAMADIDIIEPRSPAQLDALDSARLYAANVSQHVSRMIQNTRDYTAQIHSNARSAVSDTRTASSTTQGTNSTVTVTASDRRSHSRLIFGTTNSIIRHRSNSRANFSSETFLTDSSHLTAHRNRNLNSVTHDVLTSNDDNLNVDIGLGLESNGIASEIIRDNPTVGATGETAEARSEVDMNWFSSRNLNIQRSLLRSHLLREHNARRLFPDGPNSDDISGGGGSGSEQSSFRPWRNRSLLNRSDLWRRNNVPGDSSERSCEYCSGRLPANSSNHNCLNRQRALRKRLHPESSMNNHSTQTTQQQQQQRRPVLPTDEQLAHVETRRLDKTHSKSARCEKVRQWLENNQSSSLGRQTDDSPVASTSNICDNSEPVAGPSNRVEGSAPKRRKLTLMAAILTRDDSDSDDDDVKSLPDKSQQETSQNKSQKGKKLLKSEEKNPLLHSMLLSSPPSSPPPPLEQNNETRRRIIDSTPPTETPESPPLLSDEPPTNRDTFRPIGRESNYVATDLDFRATSIPTPSAQETTSPSATAAPQQQSRIISPNTRRTHRDRMIQMLQRSRRDRVRRLLERSDRESGTWRDDAPLGARRSRLYNPYSRIGIPSHRIPDIQITAPADSPPEVLEAFEVRRRELLELNQRIPLLPREERTLQRLQQHLLHPHYAVSILDDSTNRPTDNIQSAINRAIAGAFMSTGEPAVASNIVNVTHRIQRWDFRALDIPNIKLSDVDVIVPHCKIHNDASCEISQDGLLLATFVPSHGGFPDSFILAVYSLQSHDLARCLYTKSFGPNAISVGISPTNNYVLVGLAAKRLSWVFSPNQMIAQIYELVREGEGEASMQHVTDVNHPCQTDMLSHVSVNTAKWLTGPGEGIIYGTNKGDLHICTPGTKGPQVKKGEDEEDLINLRPSSDISLRRNLMEMLGIPFTRSAGTSTQPTPSRQRTASTQTPSNMFRL